MIEAVKHPPSDSLLELLPAYESNMPTSFRLSVLVPVYNERHVVATSVRRLLAIKSQIINDLEVQLRLVSTSMPLLRRVDRMWPWSGLSLIAFGVKD